MGLSSLNSALSGLRVSKQQINLISTNISNATTPGYNRKLLPQSTQTVGGAGIGVLSETIIRNVDINLRRDLWTQVSSVGALNIQETYLSRVEQFHGPPDRELSVAAEIARLKDSFAVLSDIPDDTFALSTVVNQAVGTANKINDLADLINTLRNDAQNELEQTVNEINGLLEQISELNQQVAGAENSRRSTAQLEDERDAAIQELSGLIEISFFTRGDGAIVVQTNRGSELAGTQFTPLTFEGRPLSASSRHPDTIDGIFLSPPTQNINAIDITTLSPGGKLGGLIELRDEIFPQQTAQIDELAHKLALRFDAQGLRLFTDQAGSVPADTPPDPTTDPVTPVTYVGFGSLIEVNSKILADNTLLRTGTTAGANVQSGSNEVVARVIENVFGRTNFSQAEGVIDLRVSAQAAPNNTLQNWLGLASENNLEGSVDLTAYGSVADILAAGGESAFGITATSETDSFTITFSDPDIGTGPHMIEIDLRGVPASGVNAAQDLVDAITADPDWATAVSEFGASVSIGTNGQLSFETRSDITIAAAGAEPLSDLGFAFLGLNPGTTEATDPYFDVAVGNDAPTRIVIAPGDTETELLAKLNAVPGLAVEDITVSADGFLRIRPGNDFDTPDFGGPITITGGPFDVDAAGINGVIGPGTVPDGINIVSALFGSFSAGVNPQDVTPISEIGYGSQTNGAITPPIPTTAFRTSLLGPGADISTGIIGQFTLESFAQGLVNEQTQSLIQVQNRTQDELTLRDLLQTQITDESGVNIDEELANLLVYQTSFAASARVVTAINELFDDLLAAFR